MAELDQRFIDIYAAARARIVDRQKQIALIVIRDDDLLLYRHDRALERFPGLIPPLYHKMKTLGHIPLGVFSLLRDRTDEELPESVLVQVAAYRAAIEAAADALDAREEAKAGILPRPNQVYPKVTAFLDAVLAERRVSDRELDAFARSVGEEIPPLLAAAAVSQGHRGGVLIARPLSPAKTRLGRREPPPSDQIICGQSRDGSTRH